MARPRTGSVCYRPRQKLWHAAVSLGEGKRRSFYAKTEDEARQKLRQAGYADPPTERRKPQDLTPARAAMVRAILARGREMQWPDEEIAFVVAVSMTPGRVRYGITGPCAYCGTEYAESVDHVVPMAHGGSESRENVVSSCKTCNYRKGDRTPEEWPH